MTEHQEGMEMTGQMAVYEGQQGMTVPENRAAAIDELAGQVALVQEAMGRVLVKGVHYGTIPGTQRPSLWQPGAELICQLFSFRTQMERSASHDDWERGIFAYTYRCRLLNRHGELITEREATCSTEEETYRERQQERVNRYGKTLKAEHPAQMRETVMLMAQKRAYVAAVRAAGACSAVFTQDDDIVPDQGAPRQTSQAPRSTGRDTSEDQGHGVCQQHGEPYFQAGRMKSPAHKLPDGGWCNKPDAPEGVDPQTGEITAKVHEPPPISEARKEADAVARQLFAIKAEYDEWLPLVLPEIAAKTPWERTDDEWDEVKAALIAELAEKEQAAPAD